MKKISLVLFFCFLLLGEVFATGISYKQVVLDFIHSPKRVLQLFAQIETSVSNGPEIESGQNVYHQEILWIRNEFLSLEIFSKDKELLYLSIENKNGKNSQNFKEEASFFDLDVENLLTGFYARTETQFLDFLESLGINYFQLSIMEEDENFYYRLGGKSYIQIEKENYRVVKLVRPIYYKNQDLLYEVRFKDWNFQQPKVPQTIEYYLNGKLFKKDDIIFLQFRGLSYKRQEKLQKYSSYIPYQ